MQLVRGPCQHLHVMYFPYQRQIYLVKFWRRPLLSPNFFIFKQFSANFGQIIVWRPPLWGWCSPSESWISRCLSISSEMGIACFRNTSSEGLIFGQFSPKTS